MIAPALAVRLALARVDALVAREPGRDAREVAELDRRAEAVFKDLAPLGASAAEPLGEAARDLKRAAKTRLFATTFLARLADPATLAPLSAVLLDPEQDPEARVAAAQGLAALDVPLEAERPAFCAAIAQPELPRPVLDEALIALTRLGCADPAALERAARAFGPRPDGRDLVAARRALDALARSPGRAPVLGLLALAGYFPSRSGARAAAVAALGTRAADLPPLAPEALPVVRELLRSETSDAPTVLVLVRLAGAFGPAADGLLRPLAAHPDPAVRAAAAARK